ncbi:hypothetical protein CHS0354_020497 [Potamilus streckersoni]|uniref:Coiled-coil domain-containing protein n=1 Tax=Potamilus streckersoni TaxID=2493646 RepID=A0AAE0SZ23_9BIVA|nr:hypothetical protein CHS0354_020497 [Potamilus streckersoni]
MDGAWRYNSGRSSLSSSPEISPTSLRPRPVTATVTKPKWMQPEAIVGPRRSHSVESRGSTASLTSILDHDSYESLSLSDDDELLVKEKEQDKENLKEREIKSAKSRPSLPSKRVSSGKKQLTRKYAASLPADYTETDDVSESKLSPWEQWLIEKAKEAREKKKLEREKKKQEKLEQEKKERPKLETKVRREQKYQEWVEKKTFEENLKLRCERQKQKTKKMIEAEKKKREEQKAIRKYNEWLYQKKQKEREQKLEEKRKKQEEEEEKEKQLEKAKEKYEEWLKKAQKKPKSVPNSFGYTSGKLTGYHDMNAYPVPSFYNPIPWQPLSIPKSSTDKPKKKRAKPKYVWNPEKYR